LGVQVQSNFITVGNWPLAAATSFLMLFAFLAIFGIGAAILKKLHLDDIRLES
jgi:ABC-type spermidine/putrescine transport system permease subunit I